MRRLYTILFWLCLPFIILRLLWKSRKIPAYRQRITERLTLNLSVPSHVDVWLHAVSLGEVMAATNLIELLLVNQLRVLVTTMTPTGSHQVQSYFKNKVIHQYIPYDLPSFIRRFLKHFCPKVVVVMETEMWPNMIHQANILQVPLLIVNARISKRAFLQYKKARYFFQPILQEVSAILAQSQLDADRFLQLSGNKISVKVIGNMKFDLPQVLETSQKKKLLQQQWGQSRPVLILASTHENEEQQWLEHLLFLQSKIPHLLCLIAPRHPERFNYVYELVQNRGFQVGLSSVTQSICAEVDVIVLDVMGELRDFYQLSDYAFVGGSLVAVGGHNVLEPMMAGIPVFCGPYMHNSQQICDTLCAEKALYCGSNIQDLILNLITLFKHPDIVSTQVQNATRVIQENQGVVRACFEVIQSYL